MSGWIADYRKELESDIWIMPPMYHRVWQWLKYQANHAEAKIPNKDGSFTTILPGQHATSYRHIAKGVGFYEGRKWKEPNVKTVKSILDWLVKQKMISIQGNTLGTVVTIDNWEVYQSQNIEGNTKRITPETLREHHLDTNNNDKQEKNNDKQIFLSDSIEYRLADYLYKFILKNNPNFKKPNLETWSGHTDKMIRIDKRDIEEIKSVIKWCQSDPFWSSNVLSTAKLRKQYDQLLLKSKAPVINKYNKPTLTDSIKNAQNDEEFQKFLNGGGNNG